MPHAGGRARGLGLSAGAATGASDPNVADRTAAEIARAALVSGREQSTRALGRLQAIEITVALEKKYKIRIRDEDIPSIITVRQAVDAVNTLISSKVED